MAIKFKCHEILKFKLSQNFYKINVIQNQAGKNDCNVTNHVTDLYVICDNAEFFQVLLE